MSYIDAHYEEVEREYQIVLQQAEETRHYWKKQNRDRIASINKLYPKLEYQAAWEKLQVLKSKRKAIVQLMSKKNKAIA